MDLLDRYSIEELTERILSQYENSTGSVTFTNEKSMNVLLREVIAPITPVLGVSEKCFRQSLAYVNDLFSPVKGTWGKQSKRSSSRRQIERFQFVFLISARFKRQGPRRDLQRVPLPVPLCRPDRLRLLPPGPAAGL